MSAYSDGRRREYQVRDDLRGYQWIPVMRASSSKGVADLAMVHPTHGLALIQVGSRSKRIGPRERGDLCSIASMCSALPLLAVVIPRQGITYYHVTPGMPKTWHRWSPEGEAA